MQEKSHNKSPFFARVENLRIKRDLSWDQIAELLGINRSYLFHIKAGRKSASRKLEYRLETAEREAGILPPEQPGRSRDRPEKQGDSDQITLRDQHAEYDAEKVPTPGNLPPDIVQSLEAGQKALETRLAVLERGMSEALKLLREISKATKEG